MNRMYGMHRSAGDEAIYIHHDIHVAFFVLCGDLCCMYRVQYHQLVKETIIDPHAEEEADSGEVLDHVSVSVTSNSGSL